MRKVEKIMPYFEYSMTQDEVGKALGETRGNINYIEKQAWENFRKALAERNIKISDLIEVRS